MHDQWMANEWRPDSSSDNGGGVALAEPIEFVQADGDEEEMPKPFLNEYLPTPAEIRRACREIQEGWTESERRRRRGYRRANRQPHILRTVRTAFTN